MRPTVHSPVLAPRPPFRNPCWMARSRNGARRPSRQERSRDTDFADATSEFTVLQDRISQNPQDSENRGLGAGIWTVRRWDVCRRAEAASLALPSTGHPAISRGPVTTNAARHQRWIGFARCCGGSHIERPTDVRAGARPGAARREARISGGPRCPLLGFDQQRHPPAGRRAGLAIRPPPRPGRLMGTIPSHPGRSEAPSSAHDPGAPNRAQALS